MIEMAAMPSLSYPLAKSDAGIKSVQFSAGLQAAPSKAWRADGLSRGHGAQIQISYGHAGKKSRGFSNERRKPAVRRLPAPGGVSLGISQSRGGQGPVTVHAIIDWAALPAWLVKTIATRVYPSKPCGEGKYLDPRTESCVYICQPGYAYDASTKACVPAQSFSMPSSLDNYVVRKAGEEFPDCGDGFFYDGEQDACVPATMAKGKPNRTWGQIAVTWLARRLFKLDDTSCPVGFYHDPVGKSCVPLCSPGFLYDPALKKCIPASELLMQQQEAYKRRAS